MKKVDAAAPAYQIVFDKLKEIKQDANIDAVYENITNGTYVFDVSRDARKTKATFSEEFLEDLRDCPGKDVSKYWKELENTLTNALVDSMENSGIIEFSKEILKELIFKHIKELLQNYDHVNKYNLIGKSYHGAEGSLEQSLKVTFTKEERANAGLAFEELKREGVIIPTYKDLVAPEDWVRVKEAEQPERKVEEKKEDVVKVGDLKKAKEIPIKEVFLSSTIENLVDCRAEVVRALEEKRVKVVHSGSPDFAGLPPNNTSDICLERVQSASNYILIVDRKYGGPYKGKHKKYEGLSITHAEFRKAREDKEKPVLVYVREEVWKEYQLWKDNPELKCKTDKQVFEMLKEYDEESQWMTSFQTSVDLKDMIIKRLGIGQ